MQLLNNPTDDPLGMFAEKFNEAMKGYDTPIFEPTGVQEEIITTFGRGQHQIILCLHNNKGGKTATAVNILKQMFWYDPNDEFFRYQLFRKWPFDAKQGRVVGTVKNTADDGPIRKEIQHWWPKSRFLAEKLGKKYYSRYLIDTGWEFDVLTYEQEPQEFEGPFLSWTWCDEPPPEKLVGAITSRFIGGGIWLITATPIRCGPFLSLLSDIKDKGGRIVQLNASLFDFSKTSGKPNHKGRMKGLWTDEMIRDYVATIPPDEYDARILGKGNAKSGTIYPMFNRNVHVVGGESCPIHEINFTSSYARASMCFCTIDPHKKGYPAIQWWMLTPDSDFICYNEWPTKKMLNMYYDEARKSLICPYNAEEISRFIKILDCSHLGLNMQRRAMDPRFGKGTEGEYGRGTESLMTDYAKFLQPVFELPPAERIDVQRDAIRRLLHWDPSIPVGWHNRPHMYFMPHCINSIRAIERHYWDEEKEAESERYKDFVDTIRNMMALLGHHKYVEPQRPQKKIEPMEPTVDEMLQETALG
jgi:hypothetical protein